MRKDSKEDDKIQGRINLAKRSFYSALRIMKSKKVRGKADSTYTGLLSDWSKI